MDPLLEHAVLSVKNRSHAVTAQLHVDGPDADGVAIAQGGAFPGWSLYLKHGVPKYAYNLKVGHTGSPVTRDYTPETSRFTGTIEWVQIDVDRSPDLR
jgi:hypothetical protein